MCIRDSALDWLATERPLVMAGCTDIYPLHQTPALGGPLLDITGLAELRGITLADGWRRIGAATSWTDILRADLPPAYDGLKAAAAAVRAKRALGIKCDQTGDAVPRRRGGAEVAANGAAGLNLHTADLARRRRAGWRRGTCARRAAARRSPPSSR